MKVNTAGPFAVMETDSVMETERVPSFCGDSQENTTSLSSNAVEVYDAKLTDRNTPGDLTKHGNGIQPQPRTFLPAFVRSHKPITDTQRPITPVSARPASALSVTTRPDTPSAPKVAISTMNNGLCKPLWQHTMTNAEEISALGLSQQDIRRQETIFELIYTESEYLDDLKNIHKVIELVE